MNWTLRPYQKRFVKNLAKSLIEYLAVIACAPTGSGKSKMMATIATSTIQKKAEGVFGPQLPIIAALCKELNILRKTVLIVTESKKIYDQLEQELQIVNINAGIKNLHILPGKVYLAMAQTLTRRPQMIAELSDLGLDLVVMNDEAHIGTATNVLKHFKGRCYMLGFTATPDYRAAKHLPLLYNHCVQACQVDELIQDGFLCTYRHIARDKANLDILEMRNGDYSEESQEKAFTTSEVYDGLLEDLEKHPFKKAMVFTASIKQCEETYTELIENGFKATRYHSDLKNADYELAKFTELDLCNVCVSVSSLTKGFDFPAIDLVCLLRKTNSLPLYLQMIGRGSRPIYEDGVCIKSSFIVLDYGSHWKTLGLYWDDRDWTTLWQAPKSKKKKEPGDGVSSVKACENCDELIAVQCRVCPSCGYEYPEIKKELEIGEAVEVTKSYTDLIGKKTSELNPRELAIYAKIKNKKRHAIRIAMYHEFRAPGFVKKFGDEMGLGRDWITATEREARAKAIKEFVDLELK
jgi:superfamily II DNA or RNA helicase